MLCPIMRLWTLVLSIQPSHLPNYTIFACFAWTQTLTIFHITKLLADWHQNVLADALYLLMKDGCDQFKILNSELQVLKPLNSVVGISNSQQVLFLYLMKPYTRMKKKKNLIGSFHFFFLMYKNHIMCGFKPPKKL